MTAAASSRPVAVPSPCFVFVGSNAISEASIAQEMQYHPAANPHESRQAATRALVVRELLRLEVERLGMTSGVKTEGETHDEANIRVLLERHVRAPGADRVACRRFYEQNCQRLHQPDLLLVRHILLAAAPDDVAARLEARERGEGLIAQLQAHMELFAELAQRYSACPSRDQGGDLGWIERGNTVPEFERQLFMLPCGLAGLTLESRYGHHVVSVDEIRRGRLLTFEEAEGPIAAYLETQAKQNAIHDYLQMLAERHGVRGLAESGFGV